MTAKRLKGAESALFLMPEKKDGAAFVYILRCSDGTLYTGWTNDLKRRVAAHSSGSGAKYTKGRGPVELVYFEELPGKEEALKREAAIKKMKKSAKLELLKILK